LRLRLSPARLPARLRIWWNWQTRYFEVVVPQGVQVQVLLCAPIFLFCFYLVTNFLNKKNPVCTGS
jgi:hypothetical protein